MNYFKQIFENVLKEKDDWNYHKATDERNCGNCEKSSKDGKQLKCMSNVRPIVSDKYVCDYHEGE